MKIKQKHIFAAYLNMARQNAYTTLLHITKMLGVDASKTDESQLDNIVNIILKAANKPEQLVKVQKMMYSHFPFLKPMSDTVTGKYAKTVSVQQLGEILKTIFYLLNLYRNEYSHSHLVDQRLTSEETKKSKKQLLKYLGICFDGGRRIIKDRFKVTEEKMKFIVDDRYYNEKEYDCKTGKQVKKYIERNDFPYRLGDDSKIISDKGLALFICLFIEKKYANLMLEHPSLHFFPEKATTEEKKIIKEIFSVFKIRTPKERVDCEKGVDTLALDILNELRKCPKELFETLSEQDQKTFRIVPDYNDKNSDEELSDKVLMMRYSDRFSYLVMRYIDENKLFNSIRFQVSLGKYRYNFYKKQCIDSENEDRVRAWQIEVNGFGRLQEIEELRKTVWANLIRPFESIRPDEADSDPYITDSRANYIVHSNRIGMAFNNEYNRPLEKGKYLPTLNGKETKCLPPTCWLSVYELPALVFYHMLCNNQTAETSEKIIKNYVDNYQRLFRDIRDGKLCATTPKEIELTYKLKWQDIPDKLTDYLSDNKVDIFKKFNTCAANRIDKMIEGTKCRLKIFQTEKSTVGNRKQNKYGKKSYVDIRPGRLAVFLAKDIMLFQPSNEKGTNKLTGLNYQVMQSSLAIYDKSPDEIKNMFESAGLLKGDFTHPFLSEVTKLRPKNTMIFYEEYLKCKIKWLENCKKKRDFNNYAFLHENRKKWTTRDTDYYKELAERYLTQPVELPRGLFTEVIKEKLKENYGDIPEVKDTLNEERCNVAYLINIYFKNMLNDEYQNFYKFKRTYKILNILENKKNRNQLTKFYYIPDKITDKISEKINYTQNNKDLKDEVNNNFKTKIVDYIVKKIENTNRIDSEEVKKNRARKYLNEYFDNEKLIRRYKVQDILLFLIAKNILIESKWENENGTNFKDFKLKKISATDESNILTLPIEFKIKLTFTRPTNKAAGDGTADKQPVLEQHSIWIHQKELKLKNYGDFFKFIYDDRIKTLLPQVEEISIDRMVLEKELETYDVKRISLFSSIHSFEEKTIYKHPHF